MNELFVNVKVDREERPDVDAVYMDAVQALTGRGGWPMTVFMTPDRQPFYGGTYFPKPQFLALMTADRRRLPEQARRAPPERRSAGQGDRHDRDDRTGRRAARRDPPEPGDPGAGTRLRPRLGRVRPGPEVPVDVPPRVDAAGLHDHRRRGPAGHRLHHARRHGVGRDVRPHRWGLRPLLGRSRMARAALREDALRPGTARARPTCTASSSSAGRPGARSSARRSPTSSGSCATPTAASTRPRTPTRPMPTGTAWRGCSTRGRPPRPVRRWPICPTTSRRRRSTGSASPSRAISRVGRSRTGSMPAASSSGHRTSKPHDGPLFDRPRTSPPSRARRQGAHRVERVVPVGAWPKPAPRSDSRTGSTRRSPTANSCSASFAGRTGAGGGVGRPTVNRRRATTALAADHAALVDAFTRLGGGHRAGPLDRRGGARWPTRCSTGSGIR